MKQNRSKEGYVLRRAPQSQYVILRRPPPSVHLLLGR